MNHSGAAGLEHLYPECFHEDADGKLSLHLDGKRQHTKGGKSRDVVILPRHQQRLREILETCEAGALCTAIFKEITTCAWTDLYMVFHSAWLGIFLR